MQIKFCRIYSTTIVILLPPDEVFGPGDQRLALTLDKLCQFLLLRGKLKEASTYGYRSLEIYENALGANADELAAYLTTSDDAMEGFVGRVFQHFVKQPIAAYGPDTKNRLVEKFKASQGNIRELIIEVAVIAASQPSNLELQES